jgi:hypothetical protein
VKLGKRMAAPPAASFWIRHRPLVLIAAAVVIAAPIMWWWFAYGSTRRLRALPVDGENAALTGALSKRDFVARLAVDRSDPATRKLVGSYVAWAGQPGSASAREDILDSLYRIESLPARLKAVLDAIAGDPTDPDDDRLWGQAVDGMARTILDHPARLEQMQELMLLEIRPRARRLLGTAMAQAAQSKMARELSDDRRNAFSADLIDVYFEPESAEYRSDLKRGIEALSGNDVGLVLSEGVEGVKQNELGILVRHEQATKQALDELARGEEKVLPEPD